MVMNILNNIIAHLKHPYFDNMVYILIVLLKICLQFLKKNYILVTEENESASQVGFLPNGGAERHLSIVDAVYSNN